MIKVLIVDDSISICKFVEKVLSKEPDINVVDYALDPYEAREKIKQHNPDVITLDVEMPRMDGLTFLRNLMRLRPMPVVMLSSLTAVGTAVTLDALESGAVDFLVKRNPRSNDELRKYEETIVKKVREAGNTSIKPTTTAAVSNKVVLPSLAEYREKFKKGKKPSLGIQRLVAIGASTGGPEALRQMLTTFDSTNCAMVIAQHMPEAFMEPFAERLNRVSPFRIGIAKDGEMITSGRGYMAPGNKHLVIRKSGDAMVCKLLDTDKVRGHRPSVDVLFNSVADVVGNGAVGVLLTGMGDDGAAGLTRIRQTGAFTVVQDEKSSAVWGMPKRAYELGGADSVFSLLHIAPALSSLLDKAA
ncbi:MAG: chemotaxis response regulator protein-glutamate methylesterase [Granulosicoccaceae bacterium]